MDGSFLSDFSRTRSPSLSGADVLLFVHLFLPILSPPFSIFIFGFFNLRPLEIEFFLRLCGFLSWVYKAGPDFFSAFSSPFPPPLLRLELGKSSGLPSIVPLKQVIGVIPPVYNRILANLLAPQKVTFFNPRFQGLLFIFFPPANA